MNYAAVHVALEHQAELHRQAEQARVRGDRIRLTRGRTRRLVPVRGSRARRVLRPRRPALAG